MVPGELPCVWLAAPGPGPGPARRDRDTRLPCGHYVVITIARTYGRTEADGVSGAAVKRVLAALADHGSRVEQRVSDSWMAQCPADGHDDRTASLSIAQGDAGAVVCCQAGCDTKTAVLPPLNLGFPDLFDQPRKARERAPRRVIAEYRYTDENGELLFVKVRFEPKDFRVKRPDGRGGWAWSIGAARRVLYRLPEVAAAVSSGQAVWLVEGEKDADRLAAMGYAATCNFDGAAKDGQRPKWRPEYAGVLRGADVEIVADRDAPGVAHARAIAASLDGKANSVVIMQAAVEPCRRRRQRPPGRRARPRRPGAREARLAAQRRGR